MLVFPGLLRGLSCPSPYAAHSSLEGVGYASDRHPMILISFLATAAIGWLVGLTNAERNDLMSVVPRLPLLS